ncbi:MAG TPA: hypothetical protein VJT13_14395 [Xanthobacteraceae bacterium]|nr:hypothetical protein [Xanthobacteraceae bacterium]
MSTRLLLSLLAGAFMIPQAALGDSGASSGLKLPPIPFAETVPWLAGIAPKAPPSLGLLLAPVPLAVTPIQFAAVPRPDRESLEQFAFARTE